MYDEWMPIAIIYNAVMRKEMSNKAAAKFYGVRKQLLL